jgi:hypothetical protein
VAGIGDDRNQRAQQQSREVLTLYRLLAEFDPSARVYLDRLQHIRSKNVQCKPDVNILSPRNLLRLLTVMCDIVISKIVQAMKLQGVCSIIADGTQDESKMEACCLLLRYIEADDVGRLHPVERTIGIFTTGDTTGEAVSKNLVQCLSSADVGLESVIGQSYDGAGNMSGKYQGVCTKISQLQPKALHVWCKAHRLNLVIEGVVSCCGEIRNAIGIVQELYNFFAGHKRHAVLMSTQETEQYKRTLKRVSDTTRS